MSRFLRSFISVFLLLLLQACDLPLGQVGPTPYPESYLPTVIALTAAAAQTQALTPTEIVLPQGSTEPGPVVQASLPPPTIKLTPTPTRPTPTPIPPLQTPTPPFTATPLPPPGPVEITAPGPLSKVASPLRLRGYAVPGAKNLVNVELFGEDGRLVAENLVRLYGSSDRGAYLSLDIPFTIDAAAELARLQVTTADESGRPLAVVSVHILLLSTGASIINSPGPAERCVFFSPSKPGLTFSGGSLQARGRFQPFNDQPVLLELLDASGKVLDSRPLSFSGTEMQIFATNLSYNIQEPTAALLVLRQADGRIPGPFYLFSRELTLLP